MIGLMRWSAVRGSPEHQCAVDTPEAEGMGKGGGHLPPASARCHIIEVAPGIGVLAMSVYLLVIFYFTTDNKE